MFEEFETKLKEAIQSTYDPAYTKKDIPQIVTDFFGPLISSNQPSSNDILGLVMKRKLISLVVIGAHSRIRTKTLR